MNIYNIYIYIYISKAKVKKVSCFNLSGYPLNLYTKKTLSKKQGISKSNCEPETPQF